MLILILVKYNMKSFVTIEDIYQAAKSQTDIDVGVDSVSTPTDWHYGTKISIDKIKCWEKIYFQPGNLGIYAAHDPYVEYYIIVPYFFIDCVEIYYGTTASEEVYKKAKEIGINLEVKKVWTSLDKMSTTL